MPGRVHVRARGLAERPLLRIEAAARNGAERLARGWVERVDGEPLGEHMREVGEAAPGRANSERPGRKRGRDGRSDAAEEHGATAEPRSVLALDLLTNGFDRSGKTHSSSFSLS